MRKGTTGRDPQLRVAIVAATVAVSVLAACARSGPPAPVVDRTGAYSGPAAPAASRATVSSPITARRPSAPAPQAVTTAPLGPRAPITSSPTARTPAPVTPSAAPAAQAKRGIIAARRAGAIRVRKGDTLFRIARREKIPIRALIDENRLRPPYRLRPGQRLRFPSLRVYVVAAGDTVHAISRRFNVSAGAIVHDNGLKAPRFGVFTGQRLVLPWRPRAATTAVAATPAARVASPKAEAPSIRPAAAPAAATRFVKAPPTLRATKVVARSEDRPPPRSGKKFLWPLRGKVVSGFGAKASGLHNDGINIAGSSGAIVRAAENGVVAYSGNELRGYGNLLLLRHADGWISAYAHNGELLVRRGQIVRRGQPIARVGRSGAVTTPQLHFELRRGRQAVDPRRHLG